MLLAAKNNFSLPRTLVQWGRTRLEVQLDDDELEVIVQELTK